MNVEHLGLAALAAFVIERLVEALVKPLWTHLKLNPVWLLYVAWAIGSPLAWFTGLNAFPVFAESALVGRVLTCLAVGLGSSFIYDLTDKAPGPPMPGPLK